MGLETTPELNTLRGAGGGKNDTIGSERGNGRMESTHDHYTNSVHVITSLYEVVLNFWTETPVGKWVEDEKPTREVVDEFRVRMSPQHAKALAALLVKHVREYERQFGTQLVLPPELQMLWDEHAKAEGDKP